MDDRSIRAYTITLQSSDLLVEGFSLSHGGRVAAHAFAVRHSARNRDDGTVSSIVPGKGPNPKALMRAW